MAEFVKAERILCKMVGTKNLDRYIQFESCAAQRGEVYSGAASPFGADAAVETAQSFIKSWKDMDYIHYHPQTKFRKILVHPRSRFEHRLHSHRYTQSPHGISLPLHQMRNFYEVPIYKISYSSNTEPDIQSTRRTARRGEVYSTAASPLPNATGETGQEQGKIGNVIEVLPDTPDKNCPPAREKRYLPSSMLHSHYRATDIVEAVPEALPGCLNASFIWHKGWH
ncbi:hypothetical protein C8J57DRAFT_1251617 [Mycena rebaudengoi]|nr:hypothetical protein C8J57DRAFT_1251617 [Mycena rebaudengoi]